MRAHPGPRTRTRGPRLPGQGSMQLLEGAFFWLDPAQHLARPRGHARDPGGSTMQAWLSKYVRCFQGARQAGHEMENLRSRKGQHERIVLHQSPEWRGVARTVCSQPFFPAQPRLGRTILGPQDTGQWGQESPSLRFV